MNEYVFELPIRVRDYEVDSEGIVNNANYLHYLEITRHEFCRSVGFSFRSMHEQGLAPVVRKIEIEYLSPLGLSDEMVSKLALTRKGPLFVFRQDIYKPDGTPVVRAVVSVVSLKDGRLTRGDELAAVFSKYMVNE